MKGVYIMATNTISFNYLKASNSTLTAGLMKSGSMSVINGMVIITKSTYNIYATRMQCIHEHNGSWYGNSGSNLDSDARYTVKANTVLKIIATSCINKGGKLFIVADVKCGGYDCCMYVGQIYASDQSTWSWANGSPAVNFGVVSSTAAQRNAGLTYDRLGNSASASYMGESGIANTDCIVGKDNSIKKENSLAGVNNLSDLINYEANFAQQMLEDAQKNATVNAPTESPAENEPEPTYALKTLQYIWEASQVDEYTPDLDTGNGVIDFSSFGNVFGIPYQFLPTTDCRVSNWSDNIEVAGYEFSEKILAKIQLLYIQPGNTSFMGTISKKRKESLIATLLNGENSESISDMLDDYTGKLYTIVPSYNEYFSYVNPMCRIGALMLDIGGTRFDSDKVEASPSLGINIDKACFQNMDWGMHQGQDYEIYVEEGTDEDTAKSMHMDYSDYFRTYGEAATNFQRFENEIYLSNSVAFYINSDTSFQESFTNETTESMLASTINGLSDKAREIQYLLGTATQAVGQAFDRANMDTTISNIKQSIDNIVNSVSGGNSIFSTIANSVKTIVSGGRMLFPQIWSNSSLSKSYSISIKLVSPAPDPVSWYLNCYVPMCHLLGLVCPRSEYVNSYTTPFLVRAFYRGMFNIDMGIITEMSFTRGKDGSWNKDGLPLVIDVSFTIQDLYSSMGMTSSANFYNGNMFKGYTLQNVSEIDYLSNICGINFYNPDITRMFDLWKMFNIENKVANISNNIKKGVRQYVNNKVLAMYNNMWF